MAETTNDENLNVIIKQLDGTSFNVEIAGTATVGQLKQAIQRERDITPERQRLIYRAQELKDDAKLLLEHGITHQSTLHIVIRPLSAVPANNYAPNEGNVVVNMPQHNMEGYANPYEYNPHVEGAGPANRHGFHDISVLYIVKLCRFVRIFAIMDFLFLLLFGLAVYPAFFLMAALALAGYYGAKLLKRSYLMAYIVCLVLEIIVRGVLIYFISESTVSVILFILMIFIDMFVLRCVYHLFKAIPHLDADQQSQVLAYNRIGLF